MIDLSQIDLTSMVVGAAIGVPIAALVTWFGQTIWLVLSGLFIAVFSDLPNLSGNWMANFKEPDVRGEKIVETRQQVRLKQLGRFVWGTGHAADTPSREFKYRGEIKKNTLTGTYKRIGSRKATGRGVFQLIIQGNERDMLGKCVWYDHDTNEIESSIYQWTKPKSDP